MSCIHFTANRTFLFCVVLEMFKGEENVFFKNTNESNIPHDKALFSTITTIYFAIRIRTSCMRACGLGDAKCTQGVFRNRDARFPSGGSNDIWLTSGSKCVSERPGLKIALTWMNKCCEWMGWNKMADHSSGQVTAAGWKNQIILTTFKRM